MAAANVVDDGATREGIECTKITKIQVKLDGLKTQKQIVSVQITENEDLLKKLSSQLELAEKKWSKHSSSSSSGASAETAPAVTALATVDTSNCSVQFNCRELATERWSTALGFTNDGSFLISGDLEGYVNLWSLNNVERFTPLCITIKTIEKRSAVTCLAVSPDNRRIFSGILGKTIDVHDTGTTELLTSVSHPTLISNNFSLQPGSDGQVLAALSILNGFLLFDLRRSRTEPVMSQIHWPLISQRSIMFSPVDNSHIALIGDDGSYLLDLRSPAEFLGTYPQAGTSVAFNSLGTRLLCFDRGQQPVIYDLSLTSEPQRRSPRLGRQKKLVELEPTDAGNSIFNALNCCSFADLNGDVLVAGSDDGSVFTWRQDNKQEHLMILPINKDHPVHGVCCHCDSTVNKPTLAACSDNIVTIWSPTPIQSLLLSVPIRSL